MCIRDSRLPIQTEPGDGLAQPIELAENNGWLLYVGEIYNYHTRYSSDVEYLRDLLGAQVPGINCLEDSILEANHWDGMWAICWYRKGQIICLLYTSVNVLGGTERTWTGIRPEKSMTC